MSMCEVHMDFAFLGREEDPQKTAVLGQGKNVQNDVLTLPKGLRAFCAKSGVFTEIWCCRLLSCWSEPEQWNDREGNPVCVTANSGDSQCIGREVGVLHPVRSSFDMLRVTE